MRDDLLKRKSDIEKWISENRSKAFMARELGCNPKTINPLLQRLGLSYIDATKLLLKGFLSNGMPKYMDKHINKLTKKYWR